MDAPLETVVVFDCETDRIFDRRKLRQSKTEDEERLLQIADMECTIAGALVLRVNDAILLRPPEEILERHAAELTCWRDVCPAGERPFESLLRAFDEATLIVGFNQLDFDMPLMRKYYRGLGSAQRYLQHRLKCVDILANMRCQLDTWVSLANMLSMNRMASKSGSGVNAVTLWNQVQMGTATEAREARDELHEYCTNDVKLTAHLALLHEPRLTADGRVRASNALFGIASALAAARRAADISLHVLECSRTDECSGSQPTGRVRA